MIFIFEKRQVYGGRGVGGWGCLPVMIKDNNCIEGQAMVIFVHSGNIEYASCLNYHDVPSSFCGRKGLKSLCFTFLRSRELTWEM